MRILPPSGHNEGYEPATPELNTEEGVLDISSQSDCMLIHESKIVAETIILRCSLRPIPYVNKDVKVRLTIDGNPQGVALLYDDESVTYGYEKEIENTRWEGIALDYTGIGRGVQRGETFVFYGNELPEGHIKAESPLYIKPFSVEKQNYYERTTSFSPEQILVSPPGVLNARILRGYGGYYKEGVKLDEIQQVYYSLTASDDMTRVRLFSSSVLHEQHTPPPQGGRDFNQDIVFNPTPQREEYLHLSGALAEGFCCIFIENEDRQTKFISYLGETIFGHPTYLNVYFKPAT